MKLTADTITDEQIREMRDTAHAYGDGDPDFVVRVCNRALEAIANLRDADSQWRRVKARARCAEILKARSAK